MNRDSWVEVTSAEIFEAIEPAAWAGLSVTQRADLDSVLSMGDGGIDVGPGTNARALLILIFTDSPATLEALVSISKRMISRAAEIGCAVTPAIVAAARGLE